MPGCIHNFRLADTKVETRGSEVILAHDNGTIAYISADIVQRILTQRLR